MSAVTCAEMRAIEATAFAAGWTEEALLDLAGRNLGRAIGCFFPEAGIAVGYLGKGHNAGDALVALGVLREEYGWKIAIRSGFSIEECAPLMQKKWREWSPDRIEGPFARDGFGGPLLLLDGLVGIGGQGGLRDSLLVLAEEMSWLRRHAGARVAAVDLPSGVDADDGSCSPGAVIADVTFMIGNAKRGLLASEAVNAVGSLVLVAVPPLAASVDGDIKLICPQEMDFGKSRRAYDFHKGMAGRVAVVAGSERYTGAAVLCATGALRGGAGLVTLHVPAGAAAMIATQCPPEIMIRSYRSFGDLGRLECDALVVGCGMGGTEANISAEFFDWLENQGQPTVIDADALNLIAHGGRHEVLSANHVLTPHPGEFRRLAPDLADLPREAAARAFTNRFPSTLLLKGGRTLVTQAGMPLWCNATGSPGMATGGQGDLLSGVIGARLAAGDPPMEAAALGTWVCGRASEIAMKHQSEESLVPSDTAAQLGSAIEDWRISRR